MSDGPWEILSTISREGSTQTIEILYKVGMTYKRSTVCVDGLAPAIGYMFARSGEPFGDEWFDTSSEAEKSVVKREWIVDKIGASLDSLYYVTNGIISLDCDPVPAYRNGGVELTSEDVAKIVRDNLNRA